MKVMQMRSTVLILLCLLVIPLNSYHTQEELQSDTDTNVSADTNVDVNANINSDTNTQVDTNTAVSTDVSNDTNTQVDTTPVQNDNNEEQQIEVQDDTNLDSQNEVTQDVQAETPQETQTNDNVDQTQQEQDLNTDTQPEVVNDETPTEDNTEVPVEDTNAEVVNDETPVEDTTTEVQPEVVNNEEPVNDETPTELQPEVVNEEQPQEETITDAQPEVQQEDTTAEVQPEAPVDENTQVVNDETPQEDNNEETVNDETPTEDTTVEVQPEVVNEEAPQEDTNADTQPEVPVDENTEVVNNETPTEDTTAEVQQDVVNEETPTEDTNAEVQQDVVNNEQPVEDNNETPVEDNTEVQPEVVNNEEPVNDETPTEDNTTAEVQTDVNADTQPEVNNEEPAEEVNVDDNQTQVTTEVQPEVVNEETPQEETITDAQPEAVNEEVPAEENTDVQPEVNNEETPVENNTEVQQEVVNDETPVEETPAENTEVQQEVVNDEAPAEDNTEVQQEVVNDETPQEETITDTQPVVNNEETTQDVTTPEVQPVVNTNTETQNTTAAGSDDDTDVTQSDAYQKVLEAMQINKEPEPVIEEPIPEPEPQPEPQPEPLPLTEDKFKYCELPDGYLNTELQATLEWEKELTSEQSSAYQDNPLTINQIIQEFSTELFNQEQTQENEETTRRLLRLLKMYQEHLEFQDTQHLASPEHYPHLHYFSQNFNKMLGLQHKNRNLRQYHFANTKQGQLSHLAHLAVKLQSRRLENIADPQVETNTILSTNAQVDSGNVQGNTDPDNNIISSDQPYIINPLEQTANLTNDVQEDTNLQQQAELEQQQQAEQEQQQQAEQQQAEQQQQAELEQQQQAELEQQQQAELEQQQQAELEQQQQAGLEQQQQAELEQQQQAGLEQQQQAEQEQQQQAEQEQPVQQDHQNPLTQLPYIPSEMLDNEQEQELVNELTKEEQIDLNAMIQNLPDCLTNQDIKDNSPYILDFLHKGWTRIGDNAEINVQPLLDKVEQMQMDIKEGKEIKPEEFRALLNNQKLLIEFLAQDALVGEGNQQWKDDLNQKENELEQMKEFLHQNTYVTGVLEQDIENALNVEERQIDEFNKLLNLSDEEKQKELQELKIILDTQFKNVDDEKVTSLINDVSNNLDQIIGPDTNLAQSLNKDNLIAIIHKIVNAGHKDVDNLKDNKKLSGLVVDASDLDYLADNVIVELKKEQLREENHIDDIVVDLRELDDELTEVADQYDPDTLCSKEHDQLRRVILMLKEDQTKTREKLSSPEFKERIKEMISKYQSVLGNLATSTKPLTQNTEVFKTMTSGLEDIQKTTERRMVRKLSLLSVQHDKFLGNTGRYLLSFIKRSLMQLDQHQHSQSQLHLSNLQIRKQIQHLEDLANNKIKNIRQLSHTQKHCNQRKLSISEYVTQFKTTFHNFINDVKSTINSAKDLDQKLTSAEQKVNEVKETLGIKVEDQKDDLGQARMLMFNPISEVKNLYNELRQARKNAHDLIANYEKGENLANNFKSSYDTVINTYNSLTH